MTKSEIAQKIANIHNTLAQIMVSGDNAIAMGAALIEMRELVGGLQQEIQAEEAAQAREEVVPVETGDEVADAKE